MLASPVAKEDVVALLSEFILQEHALKLEEILALSQETRHFGLQVK